MHRDACVGLRSGDDRSRRQGHGEIDVVALPQSHGLAVDRDVVVDPRSHPHVAPGAERLVERHGWTPDEYKAYVQEAAAAALLPAGAVRTRRRA